MALPRDGNRTHGSWSCDLVLSTSVPGDFLPTYVVVALCAALTFCLLFNPMYRVTTSSCRAEERPWAANHDAWNTAAARPTASLAWHALHSAKSRISEAWKPDGSIRSPHIRHGHWASAVELATAARSCPHRRRASQVLNTLETEAIMFILRCVLRRCYIARAVCGGVLALD